MQITNGLVYDWPTIVISIGGAISISVAAWYNLKGKVALNEQRLDRAERDIAEQKTLENKLTTIDTRTKLTLQKVEHLEEMISGKRIDKRKALNEFEMDEP